MALILFWLGGLSFAGCCLWMGLFGLTVEAGLASIASLFITVLGFRGMYLYRRFKQLEYLGFAYVMLGVSAFLGMIILAIIGGLFPRWSFWPVMPVVILSIVAINIARRGMKKAGTLFDLRRVDPLSRPVALQENIKYEGYEVVTGFSQYGPSLSQRGRIFLEHEAQLPCIIKAKGGSVGVYELSGKKPASHVKKALLRDLAELVASLEIASKEIKGRVIEVTPVRTSVLLKKYELAQEELASVCQDLLRVEAIIDQYTKGKAGV